jgi:hypothetical protein
MAADVDCFKSFGPVSSLKVVMASCFLEVRSVVWLVVVCGVEEDRQSWDQWFKGSRRQLSIESPSSHSNALPCTKR